MDELAELQAQHSKGHGPSGICAGPEHCSSVRYLAVIERQAGELAEQRAWIGRLEKARAKLYAEFRRRSEMYHQVYCGGRADHLFAECRFMGCRSDQATLRMGNPRRKEAKR